MNAFLKYILKNMTEKKGRFFLLLFSVMLSTALFIFSLGAVDVILKGSEDTLKNAADGKEIGIVSDTEEVFFSEKDFDSAGLTNFEGQLRASGIINQDDKITYVYFVGKKDCSKYIQEGSMPETSSEPICAISDRTAKKYNLKLEDTLEVSLSGEKKSFTIKAICTPSGNFYSDSATSISVVVPYDYMETIMNSGGRYNYMTAETSEKDTVKAAEKFNDVNDRAVATSLTDLSAEKRTSQTNVSTFYIMFAIVCVICCIIIHGAFKLIINERLTVIGIFMSQGATRKKIERILLCESFLYGVFGAVFGVTLGELILYIVSRETSPLKDYGVYMSFDIDSKLIIIGTLFAIVMSVVSAYLPARSVRKLPVKDVILNRMEVTHKNGSVRFIMGIVLLEFTIVCAWINASWTVDYSIIIAALAFVGMILFLRKFLKIVSGLLAKIFRKNTTLFIAFNNVKTSKLLRGNITLLVIAFSSILLIASLGKTLAAVVVDTYKKLNYDYSISNIVTNNTDKTTTEIILDKLESLECVDKNFIMPEYSTWSNVKGVEKKQVFLSGSDPLKYAEFNGYLELKSDKYYKYFQELEECDENTTIVTEYVANEAGKKIGDEIEVEVNNKKATFKIIGIFDGKLYNTGCMMIVKPDIIKKVFNIQEATSIRFNIVGDADTAENEFKKFLADIGATYMTNNEMMENNKRNNQQIVSLLAAFSIIAMLVASIGIFNNITISFRQRRKEFAVMASVGMDSNKRKRLVFSENMYCVFLGILLSIPFTFLVNKLISKVLITLNLPMVLSFDWNSLPMYSAILVFVIFVASLSTMRKSKMINVVQELKYE